MFFPQNLIDLSTQVLNEALKKNIMIATAESCTGGLIGAALTEIPGSSRVFDCGFGTYSYDSKTKILGVPAEMIKNQGAVSAEVARAMAQGALDQSKADIAIAVTGIAGPDGGTDTKPVGLVYMAAANKRTGTVLDFKNIFKGSRSDVRLQTVETALKKMIEEIKAS